VALSTQNGDRPLVSVGVPFFNNAATLAAAVASILGQTYTNLEIILVNDGSTDEL
jgi:glycosyltransferase involved in cell wall biosynthesis